MTSAVADPTDVLQVVRRQAGGNGRLQALGAPRRNTPRQYICSLSERRGVERSKRGSSGSFHGR